MTVEALVALAIIAIVIGALIVGFTIHWLIFG